MQREQANRVVRYGLGAIAGAAAIVAAEVFADTGAAVIVGIGLGILLGQCVHCERIARVIRETHGPSRDMYQRGKELGYQEGWRDCAKRSVRVVVPFGKSHDQSETLTAAQAPFFSR